MKMYIPNHPAPAQDKLVSLAVNRSYSSFVVDDAMPINAILRYAFYLFLAGWLVRRCGLLLN